MLALASVDAFLQWARGDGLAAVLTVLGAVLLARFIRWEAGRLAARVLTRDAAGPLPVPTERAKRRRSLIEAGAKVLVGFVGVVTVFVALPRLGIPLASLTLPGTVVGVALGFGAQTIVRDTLAGFFIVTEDWYAIGDVVRVSTPGSTDGVQGTVEEISLRTTRLRSAGGESVILPNGEVRQVANLSKEWAQVIVDVPIVLDEDVDRVVAVLRGVCVDLQEDDAWRDLLLDAPEVRGVEELAAESLVIRVTARVLPAKQWDVARELRRRIAKAFLHEGIALPAPS